MKRACWALAALLLAAGCRSTSEPETEAPPARGAIELETAVVEKSGIRWDAAKRRRLTRTITAPAEVTFDPDRTAHVGPLVDSRVARVKVKVGDAVEKNAGLAILSSVASAESHAAVSQANANLDLARSNLARQEELHDAGIDTERVHQEAIAAARRAEAETRAARKRAGLTGEVTLRSPIAGTVIERHATTGETAGPGAKLFTVADLSRVFVIGRVYERDVAVVEKGSTARLVLEAYPKKSWEGRLSYVAGALDHETRTLPVRVELDNPDGKLKPGLFGTLSVDAKDVVEALAVESRSVQRIGRRTVVFIHEGAEAGRTRFMAREVRLGRTLGNFVEVVSGLEEGAKVVTDGSFTLKGQQLRDTLAEDE